MHNSTNFENSGGDISAIDEHLSAILAKAVLRLRKTAISEFPVTILTSPKDSAILIF